MYLLFAGYSYYPRGGMHDMVGKYPSLEEAVKAWEDDTDRYERWDWGHVYCIESDCTIRMEKSK